MQKSLYSISKLFFGIIYKSTVSFQSEFLIWGTIIYAKYIQTIVVVIITFLVVVHSGLHQVYIYPDNIQGISN